MIKQLVDMGHGIGTIAVLYTKVIAAMRATTWSLRESHAAQPQSIGAHEIGVALVGAMLVADQFAKAFSSGALTVVGRCADPAKAVSTLEKVRADYVFVNASNRQKGYAKWMLAIAEQRLIAIRGLQPPISPLGRKLVESYNRQRHDRDKSA